MSKKMEIMLDGSSVTINAGDIEGQELYEVYVALTAHIATRLVNLNAIDELSKNAVNDAKALLVEALNSKTNSN